MEYFESVDHPCNGIWLGRANKKVGYKGLAKGANHGPNTKKYEEAVSRVLLDTYKKYQKKYANNPEMMRKVLAETVDKIKMDLYKGKMQIGGEPIVHTWWSVFKSDLVKESAKNITSQISKMK